MVNIEQILVLENPDRKNLEVYELTSGGYELTLDAIQEFGEDYFSVGFSCDVWLTDGTSFNCILTDEGWSFCEMIDTEGTDVKLGKVEIFNCPFSAILDYILTKKNSQLGSN